MNNDGFKDLVFAVNSGNSVESRAVFIYDIHSDMLISSHKIGYPPIQLQIRDINGDKQNEIIANGYACQNTIDTITYPIHDQCCWLIVYNNKLKQLFPPRRFPFSGYSDLNTICLPNSKGYFDLYSEYITASNSDNNFLLYHFGNDGRIINSRKLSGLKYNQTGLLFPLQLKDMQCFCIPANNGSNLMLFDTSFREVDNIKLKSLWFSLQDTLDLDGDSKKEIVSINSSKNQLTVFRRDLSQPVSVSIENQSLEDPYCSVKIEPNKNPRLVIFNNNNELVFFYHINLFYYAQWLIYAGLFLAVNLFILMVQKIQRNQIQKRLNTEKKITELQLKVVRNQMDPHFTMNAVNSVIAAIQQNEKDEATQHLLHFSRMYRHLVLTADKIKCSLAEELDFTRNYLTMEQFRFKNKFDFNISVSPRVKLEWEVPKMVIQSPVENAVKHGLLNLPAKGHLQINAIAEDHYLMLEIIDNGVGRKQPSGSGSQSTGKGMIFMSEFLELFQKVTGTKVETEIYDLADSNGNPKGTKVMVKLYLLK